jgi:hypothetical protein
MKVFLLFCIISSIIVYGEADAPPLSSSTCKWSQYINLSDEEKFSKPELFWINMDSSPDRRINMEKHLNSIGIL